MKQLIIALILALIPIAASADNPREPNIYAAAATFDCASTAVNIGAGAVERNVLPRLFHADTSFLNCEAYMAVPYLIMRFTKAPWLRKIEFDYGIATEGYSDLNNLREFVISKKRGATLWHAEPLYMFFRFDKIKLF